MRSTVFVEAGWLTDPDLDGAGFVLFDGSDSGVIASYRRTGLERRWDWEDEHGTYAFVIGSSRTGAYYDFTDVKKGESTSPENFFDFCMPR